MKQSFDPVTLEIYRALYTSVAEEMGTTLRRTAVSPNIKERRDYSCAVFDALGQVIAQGDHMPVHLGSMPMAVAAVLAAVEFQPGDVVVVNDPYAGGTHLPDVTLIAAVWRQSPKPKVQSPKSKAGLKFKFQSSKFKDQTPTSNLQPLFFVANRAHHADVGGANPGSMGVTTDIYGEGVRIPPLKIVRGGELNEDLMTLLLANMRGADERRADFAAQIGSLQTGAARLTEIIERSGAAEATAYAQYLIDYAARLMSRTIADIPDGVYAAEDYLDDDGVSDAPVKVCVTIKIKGERARIDFTGSAPQVAGSVNAVAAITQSAVFYVFRCLIEADEVPASAGLMQPLEVIAPAGTVVNALHPAPVAGGNVETSQRMVDVLFRALSQALPDRVPAASQGTMNNLTIGGIDARTGREFSYYETIAGGMGARPSASGMSAVHTNMTNSLNTPAEALEYAYPLRVIEYSIRKNSGGRGAHNGGDGILRAVEVLTAARMSLLSDRRKFAPYGLHGGADGARGVAEIIRGRRKINLKAKSSHELKAGDIIRIETPGGGGYGRRKA